MRPCDELVILTTVVAMKEKLQENQHKPPITELSLDTAIAKMIEELWELVEEIQEDTWDYKRIRRELADVINYAGSGIAACDKVIRA